MMKRLILPVIFATAAFLVPMQVHANTVRILGPADDDQPVAVSDRYRNTNQTGAVSNTGSVNQYGPTRDNETLWSISSRYRPSPSVSVYQVIGAIHRANPRAFENNNVHGLIPGSQLRMPTMAQIQREDIESVKRRLEIDQRRQARSTAVPSTSKPAPKASANSSPQKVAKAKPPVVVTPLAKPETASEETVTPSKSAAGGGIPAKPLKASPELQEQLDASDVQMTKLLESNHLLRVRLAEMRHEVAALKDQITDDEELRGEIIGFLEQQKTQPQQPVVEEPSWVDGAIANPWILAALALIPGTLIAGAIAFLLFGRKKTEPALDDVKSLDAPEANGPVMVAPPTGEDDETPDLTLSDDNDIDDLFASDESALFDDPEDSLFAPDSGVEIGHAAGDAQSLDLSFNSDDDFDIHSDLSLSSISVKGNEEAIGLQDMERALDLMEQSSDQNSDEALAAMWEQSLQEQDANEQNFDLSSDEANSTFDDELLTNGGIDEGLLDQSILDDLLSEVENEVAGQDELDTLFDSLSSESPELTGADSFAKAPDTTDTPQDRALENTNSADDIVQQAAVDQALAEAAELANPTVVDEAVYFAEQKEAELPEQDTVFKEGSVELLDEIIDADELSSDIDLEENSTALLDELLEAEDDSILNSAISIDENSTALLDELLDEADDEFESDPPELNVAPEPDDELVDIDNLVIEENSTDLLDDILDDHLISDVVSSAVADGTEAPGLAKQTDPEFESVDSDSSANRVEASVGEPGSVADEMDADFPSQEDPAAAFDAILNEALETQPHDELTPQPENIEPTDGDEPALQPALTPAPEPGLMAEDQDSIDSLVTDVESLLDEPENDDIQDLERSVDELFETVNNPAFDKPVIDPEPTTLDLDEFPVFDEDTALAEVGLDPSQLQDLPPIGSDIGESLSLDDLPEFDEEAAFNDPEADAAEEALSPLSEDEEQAALDNMVKQLQQAVEATDKPQQASELIEEAPQAPALQPEELSAEKFEFAAIDPATLPEFSENEALQASFEEQHELEQYELEQGLKEQYTPRPLPAQAQPAPADMFDEALVESAGLDMAALLTEPDSMFEVEAEPEAPAEPAQNMTSVSEQPSSAEQPDLDEPSDLDEQAEPTGVRVSEPDVEQDLHLPGEQGLDVDERERLLSQEPADYNDEADTDLVMSEEDSAIWAASTPEPELESENWSEQPYMQVEDVDAFDPEALLAEAEESSLLLDEGASELLQEEESASSPYISIEELMKDDELNNSLDLDTAPLNLEVGLDEFPDVLTDIKSFDVDNQGEFASKLDLAKAYIEMNDADGAIALLEEVTAGGDAGSQREAKSLLTQYMR
ncbi:FimV/HubP family polar landmark protein [Photobacterium sp.]|uniref:FimV/HubP family polar landmark protein n=1 Tax=Photobacterium sp. TaxID=660 RepID=UPI00299DFE54|nr:FimV/HubP family polar landmark protein [Photobacterium sp.]MDX1303685.1 FimV/HubP family polar landmark protein [Photobacterium sp.]